MPLCKWQFAGVVPRRLPRRRCRAVLRSGYTRRNRHENANAEQPKGWYASWCYRSSVPLSRTSNLDRGPRRDRRGSFVLVPVGGAHRSTRAIRQAAGRASRATQRRFMVGGLRLGLDRLRSRASDPHRLGRRTASAHRRGRRGSAAARGCARETSHPVRRARPSDCDVAARPFRAGFDRSAKWPPAGQLTLPPRRGRPDVDSDDDRPILELARRSRYRRRAVAPTGTYPSLPPDQDGCFDGPRRAAAPTGSDLQPTVSRPRAAAAAASPNAWLRVKRSPSAAMPRRTGIAG